MVQSDQDLLVEMGFDPQRATLALKAAGSLQDALTWLEKNESKSTQELETESANPAASSSSGAVDDDGEQPEEPGTAASLRCTDCGKLFSSTARAEFHASRTEHQNFEESTEVIKPLTEEEKAAKLAELKEKLAAKREAQKAIEQQESKTNELIRRKAQNDTEKIKEELRKKEQLKEMEKRKQEKVDDAKAKERVRQQIRETQEARRREAEKAKAAREGRVIEEEQPAPAKPAAPKVTASHSETRMQFRLPSGPPLVKVFPVETTLFEVASAIESEKGFKPSTFTMTFPRKSFQAGTADYGLTLKEAGMVPSCSLIVS